MYDHLIRLQLHSLLTYCTTQKNQAADSVPSECAQSAQPSPSPNDDCVDDDHDGGPQGTPSTTLPFSSEIPPPSSTPAQTTPSPEAFRHAEAAAPPVVTPTTTTTSSHVPPMTTPSPSPAATTPLPSPATTTPLPSPATTPSSPSTAPTNVDDFSGQYVLSVLFSSTAKHTVPEELSSTKTVLPALAARCTVTAISFAPWVSVY